MNEGPILQVLKSGSSIPYRPELNELTGGNPLATIFLQQVCYWWDKSGRKPFYKFVGPPKNDHPFYKPGDSWQEELGYSRSQFDVAARAIARKIKTGDSKTEALKCHLVLFWTTGYHVTYWELNEPLLWSKLKEIIPNAEFCIGDARYCIGDAEFYIANGQICFSQCEIPQQIEQRLPKDYPEDNTLSNNPNGLLKPEVSTVKKVKRAIKVWSEMAGLKKIQVMQETELKEFIGCVNGIFTEEKWRETIRSAALGGCHLNNLSALLNTFWYADGDYGKWQKLRRQTGYGEDKEFLQDLTNKPHWTEPPKYAGSVWWIGYSADDAHDIEVKTSHGRLKFDEVPEALQAKALEAIRSYYENEKS